MRRRHFVSGVYSIVCVCVCVWCQGEGCSTLHISARPWQQARAKCSNLLWLISSSRFQWESLTRNTLLIPDKYTHCLHTQTQAHMHTYIDSDTNTQTYARKETQTRTHAHTHSRTHTYTHTDTQTLTAPFSALLS